MTKDSKTKLPTAPSSSTNVIDLVLKESRAYTSMELIESYIGEEKSLANIPIQPLYVSLRSLPIELKCHALSLMTKEQREVVYDLDLWKKDEIDVNEFQNWVRVAALSPDDKIRFEFAHGVEFALFIKGKFNIWTFDAEDPEYPDHDYYFLTEDNLLLFEYDETCDIVDETKTLIRELYYELGVEKAYQYLFTIVSDGFMSLSEQEYSQKKGRLSDFGFVDYFDALEVLSPLPSVSHIDLFINKKEALTGEIDNIGRLQTLHQNSLVAFEQDHVRISEELAKVSEEKRFHFLHFNFIRLINSNLEFHGLLKDSPIAMTRVGKATRNLVNLGINYIRGTREFGETSVFDVFDFVDVHRVGLSLISVVQKRLKKHLRLTNLDDSDEKFLGNYFETFLDDLFAIEAKYKGVSEQSDAITEKSQWEKVNRDANLLVSLLPFMKSFKEAFEALSSEGRLSNSYYLNYDIDSIDFEALILSSFVNFSLDKFKKEETQKMGVTVTELKSFYGRFLGESVSDDLLQAKISAFIQAFGLAEINEVDKYILILINEHLGGYNLEELEESEFKHVGGPIIFNTLS
ncbi:DUF6178 family protein [Bacteriovorax sp. Seq25_V]|uniref:DUF6178 family protein n=1 Tax=Bacteriovorax sp. Seq25_V TaxID=1201288 RepID=UPI00038A4502|nr:DUF6178 family protein [Bacteriovorax sp. Seq25_V]EQC43839.1 hypothetical protein M900_1263 [Bacteriovorax sp. Seq25_V]